MSTAISVYFWSNYRLALFAPLDVLSRRSHSEDAAINTPKQSYVLNLPDWELPRTDELEWRLIERLADAAEKARLRSPSLRGSIHDIVRRYLATLTESAVNETIEYWLKGLGDGNNGDWPELCVELPYLEHREIADPLTLTYCVENGDGTRTELNRTTLDAVVARVADSCPRHAGIPGRAKVMAFALRQMAERLERLAAEGTG